MSCFCTKEILSTGFLLPSEAGHSSCGLETIPLVNSEMFTLITPQLPLLLLSYRQAQISAILRNWDKTKHCPSLTLSTLFSCTSRSSCLLRAWSTAVIFTALPAIGWTFTMCGVICTHVSPIFKSVPQSGAIPPPPHRGDLHTCISNLQISTTKWGLPAPSTPFFL